MSQSKKSPPRRERKVVEGRTVVVLREKHGNRYFVVDNDEELYALSLSIVRGRLASGYFYHEPGDPPVPPDYTEEDVLKMPRSLQAEARKKVQDYKVKSRYWDDERDSWHDINEACASANGRLAWEILRDRDGEYEQVSLEPADKKTYD